MRLYSWKILLFAAAFTAGACSDGALLSGGGKGDSKSKKDEEDDSADEPVPVSGSFLTCDWMEAQKTEPGKTTMIGCTVVDKDGKAFPRQGYNYQLSLYDDDQQKVDMVTADPPAASEFHRTALLPSEYNTKGYLEMTARKEGKQVGSWTLSTTDIGSNVTLGKETLGESAEITDAVAGSIPLKTVITGGIWKGGAGGFSGSSFGLILDTSFCDPGGIVRNKLPDEFVKKIEDGNYEETGTDIDRDPVKTNLKPAPGEPNTCYARFKMNFGGEDWAHESKATGCLFLRSGFELHIFSKEANKDNPHFTLENLKKFAEAKKCVSP